MYNSLAFAGEYEDKAFREISSKEGVREDLLRAICHTESNLKKYAYNHGDASATDHAFGICQVLYSTAKGLGLKDPNCTKDFRKIPEAERTYKICKLFGPRTNISYAAKFLKILIDRYNGNEFEAIAAYNMGRYTVCKDGWLYYKEKKFKRCIIGGPANFYYIKKVEDSLNQKK